MTTQLAMSPALGNQPKLPFLRNAIKRCLIIGSIAFSLGNAANPSLQTTPRTQVAATAGECPPQQARPYLR